MSRACLRRLQVKAQAVEDKLSEFYGPRDYNPDAYDKDLLGALIATVLSQHTSDLNSGRAYLSLKKAFPGGWGDVVAAEVNSLADVIRHGGLANVKAPRIQRLIADVVERTGAPALTCLYDMKTDQERLSFLKTFHGIGPKTAACVLCFNMGRPVIPVDTHVHRVARRIGLIDDKVTADLAHDHLLEIVPKDRAYSFHVHLIEHGRTLCSARNPKCACCPVNNLCNKVGIEK